jgi:hypothetical protein
MGVERGLGHPPRDRTVERRRSLLGLGCALLPALVFWLLPLAASAQGADTDGDGLPDDWETEYFGSLVQGADGDPDGDGLYNQAEQELGSDPTRFDSDGDGLSDLWGRALRSTRA